jgi:hypothetical protein
VFAFEIHISAIMHQLRLDWPRKRLFDERDREQDIKWERCSIPIIVISASRNRAFRYHTPGQEVILWYWNTLLSWRWNNDNHNVMPLWFHMPGGESPNRTMIDCSSSSGCWFQRLSVQISSLIVCWRWLCFVDFLWTWFVCRMMICYRSWNPVESYLKSNCALCRCLLLPKTDSRS